jgi:hypothetical protein
VYPEKPEIMVADKEQCDPQCGECLKDEDGRGFLVFLFDQCDSVEDESFDAVDGGTEP